MRNAPALFAAVAATIASSLAHAQTVVWTENFDDLNAASRFTVNRLTGTQTFSTGQPTTDGAGTQDLAYNYGAYNYDDYTSGTAVSKPIPAAPGSATTIGMKLQLSGSGSHIAAIPNSLALTGDFIVEGYMWGNYNGGPGDQFATMGGTGSSDYMTVGLNRGGSGTTTVSGIFPTGTIAPGYDFAMCIEGGQTSDNRVSTSDAGDDGAGAPKRNAAWPGAFNENRYNLTTGELITTPGSTPANANVRDLVDNHANSYYRTEVFPASAGFEIAGAPAKKWVGFTLEQHGRISAWSVNGKIITVLFNNDEYSGAPQFGYADRSANVANPIASEFVLYDNLKATQLPDASQNSFSSAYSEIKTSGTYSTGAGATLRTLVMDIPTTEATQTSTIAGNGTLNFNDGTYAAVYAVRGTHSITAPVNFQKDTAIQVGVGSTSSTTADSTVLTLSNASFDSEAVLTKTGLGTLQVNRIRAKAFNAWSGKTVITGAGPSAANRIKNLDMYNIGSAALGYKPGATLDLGRTVLAIDYDLRTSSANPALTNSPYLQGSYPTPQINLMFDSGFAADPANPDPRGFTPTFTGQGIITSAPEVQGSQLYDSAYVYRIFEASLIGYNETPRAYGSSGFNIDGSTVLVGFTFKTDFNFDQTVDFADLLVLAQNYGKDNMHWYEGNATADAVFGTGTVDFQDLLAIAQNYGKTIGVNGSILDAAMAANFAQDWALAQQLAVPEPATLSLLGLGAAAMVRRRR